MNKSELIDAIASGADLNKKQAKAALEATLEAISGSLKKGEPVPAGKALKDSVK